MEANANTEAASGANSSPIPRPGAEGAVCSGHDIVAVVVVADESASRQASVVVGGVMNRAVVVQYFTTNEGAQRNRELVEEVLRELAARDPGGLDYQVLLFDDGVGFMHVVAFDGTTDPFGDCAAYREFHRALAERLATPPV